MAESAALLVDEVLPEQPIPKALTALAGQARQKILNHLKEKGEYQDALRLPESRGPPQTRLFG